MIARKSGAADAAAMAAILNEIIAIGGTTAHQALKSADTVQLDYIDGPEVLTSVVAEDQGRVIGWQSVGWWQGHADIGTFVMPGSQARGTGLALFALTCQLARAKGLTVIVAAIRADNVAGLGFYSRLGFVDTGFDPEFALKDGRVVGRVVRRFDLV